MSLILLLPYRNIEAAAPSAGDPNYNSVSLLLPFNDFSDVKGNTITTTGAVTISTTVKKMGTGSARFAGNGGVEVTPSAAFDFGTAPFTIEGWFNSDSLVAGATPIFEYANRGFLFQMQGASPVFYINGVARGWAGNAGTAAAGVWHHFALCRNASGVCTLYMNGVATGVTPIHTEALGSSTVKPILGKDVVAGTFLTGYMDDFRITKGLARYRANFTVPNSPYPIQ